MSDRFLHLLSVPADYADFDLGLSPHDRLQWAMHWYWESVAANVYVIGFWTGMFGVVASVTAGVFFGLSDRAALDLILVSATVTVAAVVFLLGKAATNLLREIVRANPEVRLPASKE